MYHNGLFIYIGMQDRHVYNLDELVDALGANVVDYYAYRVCYGLAVMPYFMLRGNRLLKCFHHVSKQVNEVYKSAGIYVVVYSIIYPSLVCTK